MTVRQPIPARPTARVLVLDSAGRVLLLAAHPARVDAVAVDRVVGQVSA